MTNGMYDITGYVFICKIFIYHPPCFAVFGVIPIYATDCEIITVNLICCNKCLFAQDA